MLQTPLYGWQLYSQQGDVSRLQANPPPLTKPHQYLSSDRRRWVGAPLWLTVNQSQPLFWCYCWHLTMNVEFPLFLFRKFTMQWIQCPKIIFLIILFQPSVYSILTAICNDCGTNATCSAPFTCECPAGWTGHDCNTGNVDSIPWIRWAKHLVHA